MSAAGGGPGARGPGDGGSRRQRGDSLPERMIRESGENIRLLEGIFGLGPGDYANPESIKGMMAGRADPGETAQDLVREARDRRLG